VKVLEEGQTTKYLGRALRLDDPNGAEIEARINVTWRKFNALRHVLCNRGYKLRHRLRVFETMVSPTLLYGAGTWTLTAERERQIKTTQRKMLRSMLAEGRRKIEETTAAEAGAREDDSSFEESEEEEEEEEEQEEQGGEAEADDLEPWHVWIQRVTGRALKEMEKAGVEEWTKAVRKRIWWLAGHVARRTDSRWSTSLLDWTPAAGARRVGHQLKRWADDIDRRMSQLQVQRGEWRIYTACRQEWAAMQDALLALSPGK
jgi:hypothetical protein